MSCQFPQLHIFCIMPISVLTWFIGCPLLLQGQVALRSSSSQAQLPLTYEADAIREYWMQRPAAVVRRAAAIGSFALPYGAKLAVDYRNGSLEDVERLQVLAKELREILTDLGPTFIKVRPVQPVTTSC